MYVCMYVQGGPKIVNLINHFRWVNYMSSGCEFSTVYTCQKLWKLAGSWQIYCKNYQAYFLGPPCMYVCMWVCRSNGRRFAVSKRRFDCSVSGSTQLATVTLNARSFAVITDWCGVITRPPQRHWTSYVALYSLSSSCVLFHLLSMTHAPETGAINRLHFLAPVFIPYLYGMNISG